MTKTQSEILFEQYCSNAGINCKRIAEEDSRTPDYEITIDSQQIIVEVKEITRNKEEKESDRALNESNIISVLSNTPGDRVRKKISDSSGQIKSRTQGIYPSILVLFDGKWGVIGHLHSDNIRIAMYGLEQVHLKLPRDRSLSPKVVGMSYGPKRKMTENDNTSISAIGVLFVPRADEIEFHVYHNKFAAIPIRSDLLSKYGIKQFKLENELSSGTEKWIELNEYHEP